MLHIILDTDEVICDLCCTDYTDSDAKGGLVEDGWAICPECEPKWSSPTSHYFKDEEKTFKELVLEIRDAEKQEDLF